jgi:hypothetical protein
VGGLLNRLLQAVALYIPGGTTTRVWLHRLRGVRIGDETFISTAAILETERPDLISIGARSSIGIRAVVVAHFWSQRGVQIGDDAEAAWEMSRLGLESLSITRPYPWLDRPPSGMPLVGWFPADSSTPLPVVERLPMSRPPEELPLRAYLGQPIVLYGHHWDLGRDPDLLAAWAKHVARLDGVSWAAMGAISRSLASWRTDGDTLWVRPHTRVVDIHPPGGVSRLVIDAGGVGYETAVVSEGTAQLTEVDLSDQASEVSVSPSATAVTIRLRSSSFLEPDGVSNPRWSPWPMTRRLLSEGRDRARPWMDRML